MMRLYHSPGACSEGIAFLLAEIGVEHVVEIVDLKARAQLSPAYRSKNPKGKVPALLRPDGSVLTEFQAIAYWLARSHPKAGLFPDELEAQTRVLEMLDFLVASLHMRGFTLLKVPQKFLPDPDGQEALKAHGRAEIDKGLTYLSQRLGDEEYLFGQLTIVEGALFYILRWADAEGAMTQPNLRALHDRLMARPAAAQVLKLAARSFTD